MLLNSDLDFSGPFFSTCASRFLFPPSNLKRHHQRGSAKEREIGRSKTFFCNLFRPSWLLPPFSYFRDFFSREGLSRPPLASFSVPSLYICSSASSFLLVLSFFPYPCTESAFFPSLPFLSGFFSQARQRKALPIPPFPSGRGNRPDNKGEREAGEKEGGTTATTCLIKRRE